MKTKDDFLRNEKEFYDLHGKAVLSMDEVYEIMKLCNEDVTPHGDSWRTYETGIMYGVLHAYAAGYRYGYKAGKRN